MDISRLYHDQRPTPVTTEYFEDLAKLPTLLMSEGAPGNSESVKFVRLSNFVFGTRQVSFDILSDVSMPNFPASVLEDTKLRHGLTDYYSWHHTCWQVGKGNIYETLYKLPKTQNLNQPTVFNLNKPPTVDMKKVACMMPFNKKFDDVYSEIKLACSELSLDCVRVDEIYDNKSIIGDVIKTIDEAGTVICDLSGRNPNVMYETGIAHTLGREVVMLAQDVDKDVPFDLQHLRVIDYSGENQQGRDEMKDRLMKTIANIITQR